MIDWLCHDGISSANNEHFPRYMIYNYHPEVPNDEGQEWWIREDGLVDYEGHLRERAVPCTRLQFLHADSGVPSCNRRTMVVAVVPILVTASGNGSGSTMRTD